MKLVPATKPEDLSSISGTHMVERKIWLLCTVFWSPHMECVTHTHTHITTHTSHARMHTKQINKIYVFKDLFCYLKAQSLIIWLYWYLGTAYFMTPKKKKEKVKKSRPKTHPTKACLQWPSSLRSSLPNIAISWIMSLSGRTFLTQSLSLTNSALIINPFTWNFGRHFISKP